MLTKGQTMNFLEVFSGLKNLTFYQRREDEGLDFELPYRLRKWMEGNQALLWETYISRRLDELYYEYDLTGFINAILNPSNLAQFLVEQRVKWEKCNRDKNLCCTICDSGCDYIHPAAKYLDSINQMEGR